MGIYTSWVKHPQVQVVRIWRMLCIPEWWVAQIWESSTTFDYKLHPPVKLAGPFKTKQAAEAALMVMEEN